MNAIENRFFTAFGSYLSGGPSASIHSDSWEMKIADYSICESDVAIESDCINANMQISFPTLPDEIKWTSLLICLSSQIDVGSYSIDFELLAEGFTEAIVKLAIEIDGHDFHEKTKEQAGYDKRRDREITMRGYHILRFTGSEIYTNPIKCVQEIMNVLVSLIFERYVSYSSWYIEEAKEFDKALRGEK